MAIDDEITEVKKMMKPQELVSKYRNYALNIEQKMLELSDYQAAIARRDIENALFNAKYQTPTAPALQAPPAPQASPVPQVPPAHQAPSAPQAPPAQSVSYAHLQTVQSVSAPPFTQPAENMSFMSFFELLA